MRVVALVLVLLCGTATADDKVNARALLEQGIQLYKAGKYDDAIAALVKSYALDPQFDTLYALAQSERLGGRCPQAIIHYKKILQETHDPTLAKAVQNNLGLCVTGKDGEQEKPCTAATTTTVVAGEPPRESKLPLVLFATGGVLAGASIGLFIAASHNQVAAKNAASFADYDRFTERAGLARGFGYASAATAAVAIGAGVYVLLRRPKESSTRVSATMTGHSGAVFVQGRW